MSSAGDPTEGPRGTAAVLNVDLLRHTRGMPPAADRDQLTLEEPLEIRLSFVAAGERLEQSISVTMRTPGHDEELALGFLVGEAIVGSVDQVVRVEHCAPASPDKGLDNVLRVVLKDDVAVDAGGLLRHFFTTSSCGVCGKASLDAVRVHIAPREPVDLRIRPETLFGLPASLRRAQPEFARTGGLHAAAAFDGEGRILRVREDVGRHNAFDKLVGSYLGSGELGGLGVLLSGRASFELVQKAAVAGVSMVAAIGPPSSLALELAEDQDLTLIGFLRADGFNLYCGGERLLG